MCCARPVWECYSAGSKTRRRAWVLETYPAGSKTRRRAWALENAMERSAGRCERLDAASHGRILLKGRRVVRLDAGVDNERAVAAPVLLACECADAVNVGRRIRARESDPEKVVERAGSEPPPPTPRS